MRDQLPTFPSDVSVPMELFGKLFDKPTGKRYLTKPTPGVRRSGGGSPAAPGGAEEAAGCAKLSVLTDGGRRHQWCSISSGLKVKANAKSSSRLASARGSAACARLASREARRRSGMCGRDALVGCRAVTYCRPAARLLHVRLSAGLSRRHVISFFVMW